MVNPVKINQTSMLPIDLPLVDGTGCMDPSWHSMFSQIFNQLGVSQGIYLPAVAATASTAHTVATATASIVPTATSAHIGVISLNNTVTGLATNVNTSQVTLNGPTITSGAGAPTKAKPNGSLYMRNEGRATSRIYISNGSTWVAISSG